ncbi:MAG: DUF1648 domain-containing protein, partial [Verrucomicrobiota bacterium]|nr:DUF1648 domain-containing protein [Verrucomicrobiota bacterium]
VALRWGDLPEKIPTHYNFSGQADAWGPKSALLYLPLTAVMVWVLLSVVSFFPSLWNYPVRVTSANAAGLYRCSLNLLLILKLELLVFFAYITWASVEGENLHVYFTPLALGVIFVSVLYQIWKMWRLGKIL